MRCPHRGDVGDFDDFRNEYFNDYHHDCQQRDRRKRASWAILRAIARQDESDSEPNTVCYDRAVRHEVVNWYQQLPTDQKNALQNNLEEACNNWYNQLPQDQKDKLQSILSQTNETT